MNGSPDNNKQMSRDAFQTSPVWDLLGESMAPSQTPSAWSDGLSLQEASFEPIARSIAASTLASAFPPDSRITPAIPCIGEPSGFFSSLTRNSRNALRYVTWCSLSKPAASLWPYVPISKAVIPSCIVLCGPGSPSTELSQAGFPAGRDTTQASPPFGL